MVVSYPIFSFFSVIKSQKEEKNFKFCFLLIFFKNTEKLYEIYEKNLLKQKKICYNYTSYRNLVKEA